VGGLQLLCVWVVQSFDRTGVGFDRSDNARVPTAKRPTTTDRPQAALAKEEAERRAAQQREESQRAAQAQQEAVHIASAFESQLAELEAAAAAAEAVASAGLSDVAASQQQQRRQEQAGAQLLSDVLLPDPDLGGGDDLGMSADLLELIGALEQQDPEAEADFRSSRKNSGSSSSDGGAPASSSAAGAAQGVAAASSAVQAVEGALEREMELLQRLQVGLWLLVGAAMGRGPQSAILHVLTIINTAMLTSPGKHLHPSKPPQESVAAATTSSSVTISNPKLHQELLEWGASMGGSGTNADSSEPGSSKRKKKRRQ